MRSRLSLFLALVMLLQPTLVLAQASTLLRLSQGTVVVMKPPYDIRSDKVKTGDVVDFRVCQPVKVNGVTVIDAGARVRVTITEARHAAGFGQRGRLKLGVDTVEAVDGTCLRLRGTPDHKGGDNTALSVAGIIIFSVFFVFLQGKEAVIKADKELTAYVDEDRDFLVQGTLPNVVAAPPGPSVTTVPQGAASTDLQQLLICHRVNAQGQPVRRSEVFTPGAEGVCAWFRVAPASQDRVFDIRWYCGERLVTSSSTIVRAGQDSGAATMPRGPEGLVVGAWRVDVLRDGQVLGSGRFRVSP